MIGQTIGNFKITDQLGAGGMGEVYRARDSRLDRDVAVKVLPEAFSADAERLARFEREAKVLAGLNHPNIGAIYGIEEAGGSTFLVLELVEGEDLSQRLARGPIAVEETMEIAGQVAEALEVAHEQGIIHRDLKPANIVLSSDGRAKVLDFGLAKALETDAGTSAPDLSNSPTVMASSPTMAGVILGTAAYMSPEQARGKVVDKRADVFSFGAVLWEMLTGRQLFAGDSGDTVSDILAAVLRASPDYTELPADVPPALRQLLERCLEKDAKQRLRDIGEARIAVANIRAGETGAVEAAAPSPNPSLLSRIASYAGWIVTAALVGVILFLQSRSEPPVTATEVAGPPLRKFTIEFSPNDPSITQLFDAQISPDGRYLVYASHERLWLRDLTAPDPHPIPGTEGAVRPFWSPDSKAIAFGVGSKIERLPREGGRAAAIGSFPGSAMLAGAATGVWDENGRIVVTTAQDGLFEMPAQGGDITTMLNPTGSETDFHEVGLLPDGKGWMFVVHDDKGIGSIDVLTPDGERQPVVRLDDNVGKPEWSPSGHIVFGRTGATPGIWAVPFSLDTMEPTGQPFLVAAGGRRPCVSRDGTLIYARGIRTGQGQLTWVDRRGTEMGTVGPPLTTNRPFPSLSPDGRFILMAEVFADGRELYLYDSDNDNRRRLTFNDLREDFASWNPNGTDFMYYESGGYTTVLRSLDGSAEERVFENTIMPDITRDGSTLVAARKLENEWRWEIVAMPLDGDGDERVLVSTGGVDWWPRLSPDERYLAYVSDETGRDEVYITTYPNPTTRWQVSTDGGEWPRWRADGGEIFYTDTGRIIAVPVEIGAGLTLGTPEELFVATSNNWSARWADGFDVTADGQRLIVVAPSQRDADSTPAIVVVQNWYEEFK